MGAQICGCHQDQHPRSQYHYGKVGRDSQEYIYDVPRAPYSREPLAVDPKKRNGSIPSSKTDPALSLSAAFAATRAALYDNPPQPPMYDEPLYDTPPRSRTPLFETPGTTPWASAQTTPHTSCRNTPRPSLTPPDPGPQLVVAPLASVETYSMGNRTNSMDTLDSWGHEDYYGMPLSTSAPSTPMLETDRPPPPKPPRIKSYLEPYRDAPYRDAESPTRSLTSSISTAIEEPTSSLADITQTLERSVVGSPDGSLLMSSNSATYINDKIYNVLLQTRDCLYYEVSPVNIVGYLLRRNVINQMTEQEIMKCPNRRAMWDFLLDIVTTKGQHEFNIFCDALRRMEKHYYLADLLIVLDCLIDWLTNPKAVPNDTSKAPNGTFNAYNAPNSPNAPSSENDEQSTQSDECFTCKFQNNNDSELMAMDASSSFDIEILYFDKELRMLKPMKEVASIKEKVHGISVNDSFLVKMDLENAARYVPVISLSLYNECLCGESVETLAKLLEYHICIRELSLTKNHMDSKSWLRLSQAMKQNKSLITFEIRLNTIDDESARYIADGLKTNTNLRTLTLPSTDLTGSSIGIILEGLSKHMCLSDVDIGFNDLQDEGCKSLAAFQLGNNNMKRLRMRDSGVTDFGISKFFRAMKKNTRLTVLDISSNKIGKDPLNSLTEMLLHNRTLRELNLEKCNITRDGCRALARALRTNTSLRSLNLSMNPLKDLGAAELADGLKYNRVLNTICLNMCNIGNSGFICIIEALKHNSNLSTLKLCYNLIGQHVIDDFGSVSDITESTVLGDNSSSPDPSSLDETASSDDLNPLVAPSSDSPSITSKSMTLNSNASFSLASEKSMTLTSQLSSMYSCYSNPLMMSAHSLDDLYDKLAEILQCNKNLRVLLWGNKLEDTHGMSSSVDTSIQDLSFDSLSIHRTEDKVIMRS